MKKSLLFAAVLLGTVSASQAGVHFSFGFGIPLPRVVFTAPAPVCVAPPVVYPACAPSVVLAPPPLVVGPRVYYNYPHCYPYRHGPVYHDWDHHRNWHRR